MSGGWTAGAAGGVSWARIGRGSKKQEDSDCVEAIMCACGLCGRRRLHVGHSCGCRDHPLGQEVTLLLFPWEQQQQILAAFQAQTYLLPLHHAVIAIRDFAIRQSRKKQPKTLSTDIIW